METKVARIEATQIAAKLDLILEGLKKIMASLDETIAATTRPRPR